MAGHVSVLGYTANYPITMMGEMAGLCWGSDVSDFEKNFQRGKDCILSQHGRVLEFPQIYLLIDGYSARVMRELYTHIGGAPTRLQESTRYVNAENFAYIVPPSIAKDQAALKLYTDHMQLTSDLITQLTELGVPREDIAMELPLGMESKMIIRTNLRNLVDMSHQRLCSRAYWEFRALMHDIINELDGYSNEWLMLDQDFNLFVPKCEFLGYCPEKYCCGRKEGKKNA